MGAKDLEPAKGTDHLEDVCKRQASIITGPNSQLPYSDGFDRQVFKNNRFLQLYFALLVTLGFIAILKFT